MVFTKSWVNNKKTAQGKQKKFGQEEHVARIAETVNVCQHERVNLRDLSIDRRMILKCTLRIQDVIERIDDKYQ